MPCNLSPCFTLATLQKYRNGATQLAYGGQTGGSDVSCSRTTEGERHGQGNHQPHRSHPARPPFLPHRLQPKASLSSPTNKFLCKHRLLKTNLISDMESGYKNSQAIWPNDSCEDEVNGHTCWLCCFVCTAYSFLLDYHYCFQNASRTNPLATR